MGITLSALDSETEVCSVLLKVTETGDHCVRETHSVENSDHLQ